MLINQFDIRDEAKLNEVESVLVSARDAEWLNEPEVSTFEFSYYKAIHHFLFSDLYDWTVVRFVFCRKFTAASCFIAL